MINKTILLNKKPNNNPIIKISIFLLIIIIVISIKLDTYDTYKLVGIYECHEKCVIKTNVPYDKINILSQNPSIKYNKKEYKIKDIIYNDIYIENNIPYQEISFEIEIEKDTKLMEFTISYNKQRIIKKITNIIKGD